MFNVFIKTFFRKINAGEKIRKKPLAIFLVFIENKKSRT